MSGKRKPGGSGHADCAEILCRDGQEDPLSGPERKSWHCRKYKRGFCHAKGDFIALLDHDDLLAPNALYEIAAALEEHPERM